MALGSVLVLAGCTFARRAPDTPVPPPTYADVVRQRLDDAGDVRIHTIRHNPTLCGCPLFEVRLGETWQRVTFGVSDDEHPVLVTLREAVDADVQAGSASTHVIQGKLDSSLATCARGAIYVVLEPSAYGPPEAEEDEEPGEEDDETGEEEEDATDG